MKLLGSTSNLRQQHPCVTCWSTTFTSTQKSEFLNYHSAVLIGASGTLILRFPVVLRVSCCYLGIAIWILFVRMIFSKYVPAVSSWLNFKSWHSYYIILIALLRFALVERANSFKLFLFGQLKLKSQRTRDSRTPLLSFIQQLFIDLIEGSVISKIRILVHRFSDILLPSICSQHLHFAASSYIYVVFFKWWRGLSNVSDVSNWLICFLQDWMR